jgi:phosphoribosyl-ATP pyrophosphohydrolase/phosphoribosyl-AMP cyclohydrolase
MAGIGDLKFDTNGLIPAVVQDDADGKVLMLAYMNRESIEISMREGRTCFWSRSRQELWRKGETSGNVQYIRSITADCDSDTLLVRVSKAGPACHTGAESCFFNEVFAADEAHSADKTSGLANSGLQGKPVAAAAQDFESERLYNLLVSRKKEMPEGSYTTYLFEKGLDKLLKKIGEESSEVIIAAKNTDNSELVYELADLYYHALALMVYQGVTLEQVQKELGSRSVIDKKAKQETEKAGG